MNNDTGAFPEKGRRELSLLERRALVPSTGLRDLTLPAEGAGPGRIFELSELWRSIVKWRLLIAAIIISCIIAAILLSLLITPLYAAQATLEINKEDLQVIKGAEIQPMQMSDRDYLNTQIELLKSRSLAERVARSMNLASNPAFVSPEAPAAAREKAAASIVRGAVQVEMTGDSRIITIRAVSSDPAMAAKIANAYADNFISSNLERRYEANSYARTFLQNRIAAVRAKLEQSEKALVQYAQQQGIVTLSAGGSSANEGGGETSLEAASAISLNAALSEARAERIAAEQRYRQGAAKVAADVIQNPTVQALGQQRAQLEAEYQEKLSVYQPQFPAMQQIRTRIDSLNAEIARQSSRVSGSASSNLRADYVAAVNRENQLQARVNALKADLQNLRAKSIDYTILQREVDTNRSLYDALLQRFKEVGVAGGVGENRVSVVDRADVPGAPFTPNLPFNILLGLMAGVVLGFGTAFAIEFIDDTIKTSDDLTNRLGITPLGVIPMAPKGTNVAEQLSQSRSEVAEAYHSVRAALQFATDHGMPRNLVITSARAAEGKSSTALALAQNLASLGLSVLLVDADLRKPSFRAPASATEGLSNLLAGSDKIRECIHGTDVERLFLLPGGAIPPNPAELLASTRLKTIIDQVGEWFDVVIVDAPPVLGLADAPLLASVVEGTVLVCEAGKTRRAAALNAVRRLRTAHANILGGLLTKYNAKASGYGYGYGYGYGDEPYGYGKGQENTRQIELIRS